nr:PREDICTED: tripartite motif-containing protein 16-like protein [Lepisosteus oculatus]
MSSVNSKQAKVKELIREKCTAFASMTEKILIKLDLEVTDLKKMNTELENLSKTDDNIGFVQSFQSLCDTLEAWEPLSVSVLSGSSFNPVREVLLKLQELAEGIFTAELQNIITAVNMIPMPSLPDPTPTKRADFCKYFYGLTLDIKTASSRLTISELNTKVAYEDNGESKQLFSTGGFHFAIPRAAVLEKPAAFSFGPLLPQTSSPSVFGPLSSSSSGIQASNNSTSNPEKFDSVNQVVCAQGLSAARYYWECEWKGENIGLGVVYKGISRKGTDMSCVLGLNEKSWCLQWDGSCYVALHNGKREVIKAPYCSQIGVYLNSPAGILSFYRLADTPILLHKFKHTFTEPLYPAFHLPKIRSSVKICPVIVS